MILTGPQIKWAKEQGYLDISDWDESRLNPNSYNLRLADELVVCSPINLEMDDLYCHEAVVRACQTQTGLNSAISLDMKKPCITQTFQIPESGHVLQPGILYLARTMEYTKTDKFVPMLEGRSSVGRLGISVHSTAGFGDIGFCGYWTLEISCVQPVRIYSGVEICQIYYHTVGRLAGEEAEEYYGDIYIPKDENLMKYDSGKYQKNGGIQPSMMWKELQ